MSRRKFMSIIGIAPIFDLLMRHRKKTPGFVVARGKHEVTEVYLNQKAAVWHNTDDGRIYIWDGKKWVK